MKNKTILYSLLCSILASTLIFIGCKNKRNVQEVEEKIEIAPEIITSTEETIDTVGEEEQATPLCNIFNGYSAANGAKLYKGLIGVRNNENYNYGFIDTLGIEVISCKYSYTDNFCEDLALVKDIMGKYGYIDLVGNEVIAPLYDEAYPFSNGVAIVEKDSKWGIVDKNGDYVVPCKYDNIAPSIKDGVVPFRINNKYGIVSISGRELITAYDAINVFSEGLAWVEKDGKRGYIDKEGCEIIPLLFDECSDFSEGLAVVKENGLYGFIDKTGKLVIPCQFSMAYPFSCGRARIKSDGKYGYINMQGETVIPCQYEDCPSYATASKDFCDNIAIVCLNDKWGTIDRAGNILAPLKYDAIFDFVEGIACMRADNGKCGYLNEKGEEIIPPCLTNGNDFSEGYAVVFKGERQHFVYGLVDKYGNVYINDEEVTRKAEIARMERSSAANVSVGVSQSVVFKSELQVRSYLSSHVFKSDDGHSIRFMNNANELYVDANCVTSSISISNIAEQGAMLKAQGPYGDFIFALSVQDGAHGLVDMKTNEVYTSEKLF